MITRYEGKGAMIMKGGCDDYGRGVRRLWKGGATYPLHGRHLALMSWQKIFGP